MIVFTEQKQEKVVLGVRPPIYDVVHIQREELPKYEKILGMRLKDAWLYAMEDRMTVVKSNGQRVMVKVLLEDEDFNG